MLRQMKKDYISWIVIISAVLLLLEISFFNKGLIFSLPASAAMIYFGWKKMPRKFGKFLFWGGLLFLASSVLGMMTFRFFLLAIFLYMILQFAQSKKSPQTIHPVLTEPAGEPQDTVIVEQHPLFKNQLFGQQQTPSHVYEWNDINIFTGIGDSIIDLSYTVLPKGETIVFIRNIVGSIKIFIPYDVEVNIRHAAVAGSVDALEHHESKVFNQTLLLKTPGYDGAEQRVKIITSMLVGDLEVKRI
ncbi:cell wall-active antibiotics response protein LiaF [Mesobacillus zeae]|uniref:Cell wall-active antibiotics response protein n=1 Tax=Mesobacillus zeae TaxID=1917180 RepID=A0A398B3R1_9BACI|nr:cell wall-active antibiotics response protein LiaF [Mesobacillus zeae]RID82446.1 cell wall-active antibiotics response protein [Mesobacillus zeae]